MNERERIEKTYLDSFPDGEDILKAAMLWVDYLGDGQRRPGIRYARSFKYAARLLAISVEGPSPWGKSFGLLREWQTRLSEFGLTYHAHNGELEVVDWHRWRHALSILHQTKRLPYRTFLWRLESGCGYDEPITKEELPPVTKRLGKYNGKGNGNGYAAPQPQQVQQQHQGIKNFFRDLTEEM
jgi:hypothetical protein